MKKDPLWGVLAFVVIAVTVICCLVQYVVEVRKLELASRNPVVLRDLNELGKRLDTSIKNRVPPQVEVAGTATFEQPETMTPSSLPTQLERCVSAQKLAELRKVTRQKDKLEARFRTTVLGIEDSVSYVFGTRTRNWPHTSAAIGYEMITLGNWESARRHLWAAVDVYETYDPTQCKIALGQLAWLEDDPEKAARLLQLSCQGEFHLPYPHNSENLAASQLENAYTLCKETDSTALAEHYLERLRKDYPIQAKEYEGSGRIPLSGNP